MPIFGIQLLLQSFVYYKTQSGMGNQQSEQYRGTLERRTRYRTLDHSNNVNSSKIYSSNKYENRQKINSSFSTPPINRSQAIQQQVNKQYQKQQIDESIFINPNGKHHLSIDVNQARNRAESQSAQKNSDKDRVLETLSKKNQMLRKQLKQISDSLTEKLKRKKLVPKKKNAVQSDEQSEYQRQVNQKQQMGLKRQLQNAYKQIQMYKKTISNLKSRGEGPSADHRVSVLENQVVTKDSEIESIMRKIEGIKKIKTKQDSQIEKDLNDDIKQGIDTYKKQLQQLKNKLKQFANKDRARQVNYKRQQAYLCDVQRKVREMDGSYFPQLNNQLKKQQQKVQQKTATSDKDVNPKQFYQAFEQARILRAKHQEYNRKIQSLLQQKHKRIQQQNDLKDQIAYKQRIIQAMKAKIDRVGVLLRPRKNSLFGYDSHGQQQNHSEVNDNQSQIERQLQQQINQDQFDIKHLIANIPKPVRKRPQEMSNNFTNSSKGQRREGGGMLITNEKAAPKKWGAVTTRTEERGKHFKGELMFEDRGQFQGDAQPIIVGVNVWVNKNNTILGIQAIYLNNNQLRYGAKSADSAEGIIRRFDLQTPDYLKNLTLTIGKQGFVESLALYSKQGKVGKFGNKRAEDQNINFGIASNQRPFLFLGASTLFQTQPRLNYFGMQICSQ